MKIRYHSIFAAIAMVVFVSCNSDTELKHQYPDSTMDNNSGVLYVDIDDIESGLHNVNIENIESKIQQTPSQRNPNTIIAGHYSTRGGHTVSFSAIENRGGIHGHGVMSGPIFADLKFEIACFNHVDNRATIGGRITSLQLADEFSHFPYTTDWIIYFAVEDNGEGDHSDPDRYHAQLYLAMPEFPFLLCDLFDPTEPLVWEDHRWFDVIGQGDQIQIK